MFYMQPTGMLMAATKPRVETWRASSGVGTEPAASLWCSQQDVLAPCTHQNGSHHRIPSMDPPQKLAVLRHKLQPQSPGDECGNSALKRMHESCPVWSGKKKRAPLIILGMLRFIADGARVLGSCWLSANFYSALLLILGWLIVAARQIYNDYKSKQTATLAGPMCFHTSQIPNTF